MAAALVYLLAPVVVANVLDSTQNGPFAEGIEALRSGWTPEQVKDSLGRPAADYTRQDFARTYVARELRKQLGGDLPACKRVWLYYGGDYSAGAVGFGKDGRVAWREVVRLSASYLLPRGHCH